MKKTLFSVLACAFVLIGCNNDADPQIEENIEPKKITITADLPNEITKIGIVEGNLDYAAGEKVYWLQYDTIDLVFRKEMWMTYKLRFGTDSIEPNTKPQSAVFTLGTDYKDYFLGPIMDPAGTCNYRAYYGMYNTHTDMPGFYIQSYLYQYGSTSTHLRPYFAMYADGQIEIETRVVCNDEWCTVADYFLTSAVPTANVSFKHLCSLLRFSLLDTSSKTGLKITSLKIEAANGLPLSGELLVGQTSLTNLDDYGNLTVYISKGKFTPVTIEGQERKIFDVYGVAIPSVPGDVKISCEFKDDADKEYTATFDITTTDADFLATGFKQGKSYVFKLKVDDDKLVANKVP